MENKCNSAMKQFNYSFTIYLLVIFFSALSQADISIFPEEDFVSTGPQAGPFEPMQQEYLVTNTGVSTIYWGVNTSADWLEMDEQWGSLDPNESVTVTISITEYAQSLPTGEYIEDIVFTDISNNLAMIRSASLTVSQSSAEPVAWWKLDGDATDSSPNGYDGTIMGDPQIVPGQIDDAFEFDGVDDYIDITGYKGITGANPRSMACWIRTTKENAEILTWGTADIDGKRWIMRTDWVDDNGKAELRLEIHSDRIIGTTNIIDGQWHHVAVTWAPGPNGNKLSYAKLYVDGSEETTTDVTDAVDVNTGDTQNVQIGVFTVYERYFEGSIDDVRIYDRVLSQQEIRDIVGQRLVVSPDEPFEMVGEPAGPFTPSFKDYTITNISEQTLYWGIDDLPLWLDADSYFGSIEPNQSTSVRVFVTEEADLLEAGIYTADLTINNLSSSQSPIVRQITLDIHEILGIWGSPESFSPTVTEGSLQQDILTIGNDGEEPVNFTIRTRTVTNTSSADLNLSSLNKEISMAPVKTFYSSPQALASEYEPGRLLVRFDTEADTDYATKTGQSKALSISESNILRQFRMVKGLSVIQIPDNMTMEDALDLYNNTEGVLYAQPNYRVYADSIFPNDARFSELWGLHNTGQSGGLFDADIDAPEAWDIATGHDVIVAVIDTGVDYTHQDLAANMWKNTAELNGTPGVDDDGNGYIDDIYGYDFVNHDGNPMDDHYHGTHCAGTIGAVGNNGIGVVGVCWNVKIMAIKFLDSGGGGWSEDAIASVEYATLMGANLSSNSWGGGSFNQALEDAIREAGERDILFVAAAGNDSVNNDIYPHYPSNYTCDNIISVMATDRNDVKSSFSNYGLKSVDIGAPGSSILSCEPGNQYQSLNGTSMATPHVSGACALLWSINPSMSAADVKATLLSSVDPTLSGKCASGGRLNINNAILATKVPWIHLDAEEGRLLTSETMDISVTFDATGLTPGVYRAEILVLSDDLNNPTLTIPVEMTVVENPLDVMPESAFDPNGFEGGPFIPDSMIYTIHNNGTEAIDWSIEWQTDWLIIEPNAGTLAPDQSVEVTLSLDSMASDFLPGLYSDQLKINNVSAGAYEQRIVNLTIRPTDKFTEQFNGDFDLSFSSISLRPDENAKSYYVACISDETIGELPSDFSDAVSLPLGDDDFADIQLQDGKQIEFYGQTYDHIFVGSNGYITFGQGDIEYETNLEHHFMMPRIAPVYADLSPLNDDCISYLQTEDRFVVTYCQVPVYGDKSKTNTFQVELFFADGAIRISYMDVKAENFISGLSQGLGLPDYFEDSDFAAYMTCCKCGDVNGDSTIGIMDLSELALAWMQGECQSPGWCGRLDFDRSGQIDIADFGMFSENWQDLKYAWTEPKFMLELNGKAWTEPHHLSELDDGQGNNAMLPCLSRDRLTMYFNRHIPSLGYRAIIEATRSETSGPFTSERILMELNSSGFDMNSTWISSDNLRLYYSEIFNEDGDNKIKMAQRSSVGDPWIYVKTLEELHENGYRGALLTLTEDELTIVWHTGNRPGTGGIDLWTASRPSTDEPFDNIRELTEINTEKNDSSPCLMPDGLILYFTSEKPTRGLYKATRTSTAHPFSNIKYVTLSDQVPATATEHFVTPDEDTIYYVKEWDTGRIYMTTFKPDPKKYPAWNAVLSTDQLYAYYLQYVPEYEHDCVIEATRENLDSPFEVSAILSQLNDTDSIKSVWISDDRLRLYFHEAGLIKMAERADLEQEFQIVNTFPELSGDGNSSSPSLTSDELTVVFHSSQSGSISGSSVTLWIASRVSVDEPFSNIMPLDEINTENIHYNPWLTPDGLTIYYSSNGNGDTNYSIYKATRGSLSEPFGEVVMVTDGLGDSTRAPYVSPGGNEIYYYDQLPDASKTGYWRISLEPDTSPCLPR